MTIRRLSPTDASTFRQLRLLALRESPIAFGSSYSEEVRRPLKAFASRLEQTPEKWAFGAFDKARLVGFVTVVREEKRKERHKASIYGMYVRRAVRGRGVGRQLLLRVVEAARRMRGLRQVRLAVVEANRPALRLYESVGFKIYGREEAALCIGGRLYTEVFLACRL